MSVEELRKKQNHYINSIGGYSNLLECDDVYNDLNREIIAAFLEEHTSAFLGSYTLSPQQITELKVGHSVDVFTPYTGQMVYNFGTDFIISQKDTELEQLIQQWNLKSNVKLLDDISNRIEQLDGMFFIWT